MKKVTLFIFTAFFLALVLIAVPKGFAHAQEPICTDAAGRVIPCPPKEEDKEKKTPVPIVPTSTATATSTPLPITSSTEETVPAKAEWSGICGDTTCIGQFTNGCKSVGGTVETGKIENGKVPLTCKVPLLIEPTPLPLSANPTQIARPQDEEYLGQCTKADGDFFECAEQFVCEDGLLVIEVDLYTGNGTVYDFYCIPNDSSLPITAPGNGDPNNPGGGFPGWLPWLGGVILGFLAALFIQRISKRFDAQVRSFRNGTPPPPSSAKTISYTGLEIKNDPNSKNPEDDNASMQLRPKRAEVPANNQEDDGAMESNRHKLMETLTDGDEGGTEAAADYLLTIEGIPGEDSDGGGSGTPPPPPPPPSPPPAKK